MTESSNKTIRSCDFKTDNVNVLVGYAAYHLYFEVILSEVGSSQAVGVIYPTCTLNLVNLALLNHYPKFN